MVDSVGSGLYPIRSEFCWRPPQPQPPPGTTPPADVFEPSVGQYLIDKAKDLLTFVVLTAVNPGTVPQNLLALTLSLGTVGRRLQGSFGFAIYEHARGLAPLLGKAIADPPAYTPGFLAFAPGAVDKDTFIHEHQHALQSLVTGPLYLPGIFFEAARAALKCGPNSACVHEHSVFERDAARAEKEGLHFPFV